MVLIWNKETGEPREYETVDAREVLTASPELYTDRNPNGDAPQTPPQLVTDVESEYRREPVGSNQPTAERAQTVIRNAVTDRPRMPPPPSYVA